MFKLRLDQHNTETNLAAMTRSTHMVIGKYC